MHEMVAPSHIPSADSAPAPLAAPSVDPETELDPTAAYPAAAPEAPPAKLRPLSLKATLRIVVIGGGQRLGNHVQFSKMFTIQPVSQISYPTSLFEAGVCAASANILIFDLTGIRFSEMLSMISDAAAYCPRAIVVALLEPDQSIMTLPQCGVHVVVSEPIVPSRIVRTIETLMFGSSPCADEPAPKNLTPESSPATEPLSNGFAAPNVETNSTP